MEQCKVDNEDVWVGDLEDIYYYLRKFTNDEFTDIVEHVVEGYLSDKDDEINDVQSELDYAEERIDNLEEELDSVQEELGEARQTISELQDELNEQ